MSALGMTLDGEIAMLLRFFAYEHLPAKLQTVSKPFSDLAQLVASGPKNPETKHALRKLLEAKDCAVRAALPLPPRLETPPTPWPGASPNKANPDDAHINVRRSE